MDSDKEKEVIKKFGIDIDSLRREQNKLSKNVVVSDDLDFDNIEFIGGFSNIIVNNKVLSAFIIMNNDCEIIDQKYFIDKLKFPYIAEFRAYRELPTMISCLNRMNQKPSLVFIEGLGINHIRLGIASHFSLSTLIPSVGITDKQVGFSVENNKLISPNNEVVGSVIQTKKGSKPLFVSPGSGISVETAKRMVEKFVKSPHKMPEPLRAARRYVKKIKKELF